MIGCRPFTIEEEEAFLKYLGKRRYGARDVALITFGIQTGFRIAEILSVRRKDIIQGGKMVDTVYMSRYNMKGGKGEKKGGTTGRGMPLTEKTKKALQKLINWLDEKGYTDEDDYIFQGQRAGNTHIAGNGVWRLMSGVADKLGITGKIGTHTMRKTFADRIYAKLLTIENCDALRTLGKGMGHANINNTDKYLSFRETELVDAIHSVF
jgi:integrase